MKRNYSRRELQLKPGSDDEAIGSECQPEETDSEMCLGFGSDDVSSFGDEEYLTAIHCDPDSTHKIPKRDFNVSKQCHMKPAMLSTVNEGASTSATPFEDMEMTQMSTESTETVYESENSSQEPARVFKQREIIQAVVNEGASTSATPFEDMEMTQMSTESTETVYESKNSSQEPARVFKQREIIQAAVNEGASSSALLYGDHENISHTTIGDGEMSQMSTSSVHDLDTTFGPAYFWIGDDEDDTEATGAALGEIDQPEMFGDSDEENIPENPNATYDKKSGESPVCPGAPITPWESIVCSLTLAQSEDMSGVGYERLLSLINIHLPRPNNFVGTRHLVHNLLEDVKTPVDMHFFCTICYSTRTSLTDLCNICTDEKRAVDYFLVFPLEPQIRKLLQRPDFIQNIRYKLVRVKKNEENIEDIFDGLAYKAAENQEEADGDIVFVFMWNTDGVQVFKSTTFSMWPFYLVNIDLPPKKRFLTENLVVAGIWGSCVKPHPNVFLVPIYKELSNLKKGIEIQCFGENEPQKVTCKVVCGSCDAPATSSFLNMKSHSGFYSCHLCCIRGIHPGDSTVFPYEENVPPRSMEDYKKHVELAVKNKVILQKKLRNEELYCGIKGPTVLSHIMDDIFSSMAIDPMHCLYLGVMRQMLRMWFLDGKYKDKCAIVSQKLLELAPPEYLQRVPQPVEKLIHWKATEFRSFLFNISVVLLKDVLETEDYNHFCLFVKGVSLLNTDSISPEDRAEAQPHLEKFVKDFESLYGVDNMPHNLHMCLHLVYCVLHLGPLWSVSCFKFEDINGRLLNLIHGTRHVGLQIHKNLAILTQLPLMIQNLREGVAKDFCLNIKTKYRTKISETISPGVHCVGSLNDLNVETAWVAGALRQRHLIDNTSEIKLFHRFLYNGLLYVASTYKRSSRVSSYVEYQESGTIKHGNIMCFVKITSKEGSSDSQYFVAVKPVHCVPYETGGLTFRHIFLCNNFGLVESFFNCVFISVFDLGNVLFKINNSEGTFLVAPLNSHEME